MIKSGVIFSIIILLFSFSASFGQKKSESKIDVFADVPAERRERLIERLRTFVGYYRERDLNKVYDLIGEQAKMYVEGGLSRERFLKESSILKLKEFKPEAVSLMLGTKENGIWLIWGCGEYRRFGPNKKLKSSLEAYFQDGDWYFSEIRTPHPLHGEPEGCR